MRNLILKKRMKKLKPKWLKTSTMKRKLNNLYFNIWYKFYKRPNIHTENILVIITEAMGDTIVKSGALEVIRQKYGTEKVFVCINSKWKDLISRMNYNIFVKEKGVKSRIKMIKEMDKKGFDKIIDLNFGGDLGITSVVTHKKLISLKNYMEKNEKYILNPIYKLIKSEIDENLTFEDIKPDMRPYYKIKTSGIMVGVGASHESKVFPSEKMIEVLKVVQKKYPKEKIYLLGANNKQKNYAETVVKGLNSNLVINLVNKISLIESIERVAESKLYLGFDSGLYHVAYSLKKDIVVFFGRVSGFEHPEPNIKILMGDGKNPMRDSYYGNEFVNSVKISQVEEALKEFQENGS